jgi:AAHS family 4-hydroxybenzoate transporter-like MFS transporter
VPLLVAPCLVLVLPESVTYLAQRPDRRAELLSTIRELRPDLAIADNTQLVTATGQRAHASTIRQLFGERFRWITPLVWACFATALMANFFLNSWLPLILHGNGLTAKENGLTTLCYHYAGAAGGLLVSLVLGRFGFAAICLLFLGGAVMTAAIGIPGLSYVGLLVTVMLSGFCVVGAQFCNNAASALIYPAEFRSTGVGWALGIARFGSILGPVLGGLLIGRVTLQHLFLLAAGPLIFGLLACSGLARLCYRQIGTVRLLSS